MTTPVARRFLFALQFAQVGLEQDRFEQLVDAVAGARGDGDHFGGTAPLDGLQALFGELRADAIGLRVFLVHLVDRDDDRHVGGFDVTDRLDRLRHHAVVGGDDEDRDVGDLRTARAHRRERLVTGRVDERDLFVAVLDGVRADALRDAAGFAGGDVGGAHAIEQRGLAVVDVAEDRDDRRTLGKHPRLILFLLDDDFFAGLLDDGVEAELARDLLRDVARDVLVDRRHRAGLDQFFDYFFGRHDHRGREFLNGQDVGDLDGLEHGGSLRGLAARRPLLALPLLFEQQVFFAIFLRDRVVAVA